MSNFAKGGMEGVPKKINEFPKDKTNNKGFMSRCKVCFNKYQKIRKLHIEYIELGVKFKTLLDEL